MDPAIANNVHWPRYCEGDERFALGQGLAAFTSAKCGIKHQVIYYDVRLAARGERLWKRWRMAMPRVEMDVELTIRWF